MTKLLGAAVTTLLVVAALALASWFVFAHLTGATLITFRTGSMTPTMPQGAVAVSLPVTADEVEVGDVLTVQRQGEPLPVTHRVVEIREPRDEDRAVVEAAAGGERAALLREIVMQGDANAQPDARPYLVTEARRAVFALPWAGGAIMVLQSPIGMGALTILAGALATWAFWPGRQAPKHAADGADRSARRSGERLGSGHTPAEPEAALR